MPYKAAQKTKSKIVNAAWKLFYEQGYENTTVEDIILQSKTSKGSFYHYFEGKDSLLSTLADMFDEKYNELKEKIRPEQDRYDVLLFLNEALFAMIEESIDFSLLGRLYSTQIITRGQRHLLDYSRVYYKLLKSIVMEGKERGELSDTMTVSEMVKYYALCERALLYDWCLCNGEYSLCEYAKTTMPMFLYKLRSGLT